MRKLISILLLLWIQTAVPAGADTDPELRFQRGTCHAFFLCNAQAGTGVCTRNGDEAVLDTFNRWTKFYLSSTVLSTGTYSCDITSNSFGHDAASGVGDVIATLANGSQTVQLEGVHRFIWSNCTANSGAVTIVLDACPANR